MRSADALVREQVAWRQWHVLLIVVSTLSFRPLMTGACDLALPLETSHLLGFGGLRATRVAQSLVAAHFPRRMGRSALEIERAHPLGREPHWSGKTSFVLNNGTCRRHRISEVIDFERNFAKRRAFLFARSGFVQTRTF